MKIFCIIQCGLNGKQAEATVRIKELSRAIKNRYRRITLYISRGIKNEYRSTFWRQRQKALAAFK